MPSNKMKIALSALFITGAMAYVAPVSARDSYSKPRIGFNIGIVLGDRHYDRNRGSYRIDGYRSGRWYAWDRPLRRHIRNRRYGGFDCHPAFMFGYRGYNRTRFEAIICYDRRGNYYVAQGTHRALSHYNGRRWIGLGGQRWSNNKWNWRDVRRRDNSRWWDRGERRRDGLRRHNDDNRKSTRRGDRRQWDNVRLVDNRWLNDGKHRR